MFQQNILFDVKPNQTSTINQNKTKLLEYSQFVPTNTLQLTKRLVPKSKQAKTSVFHTRNTITQSSWLFPSVI